MQGGCALTWSMGVCTLLSVAGGCGDDYGNRQAISGQVTLKGQPLDQGSISFMPIGEAAQGEVVTRSGAVIADGKYQIPRPQGLVPGKYKVALSSGASGGGVRPADPTEPTNIVSIERIPADYNVATTQEVEVKDSGKNVFDFQIP
jgi:hypothetical protein